MFRELNLYGWSVLCAERVIFRLCYSLKNKTLQNIKNMKHIQKVLTIMLNLLNLNIYNSI
jgi:hypothetical protein